MAFPILRYIDSLPVNRSIAKQIVSLTCTIAINTRTISVSPTHTRLVYICDRDGVQGAALAFFVHNSQLLLFAVTR